jgi:hypothetical protein
MVTVPLDSKGLSNRATTAKCALLAIVDSLYFDFVPGLETTPADVVEPEQAGHYARPDQLNPVERPGVPA